ncbi:MAG: hypothetical protein IKF38_04530 [Clostridia bacterium]|nr:hypothetical protein [Clostridia bacterium]
MEIFFGEVFLDKQALKDEGINYPIKLEYYKKVNENKTTEINKPKYGINIVKKEYKNNKIKVENKLIKYLSNDEARVNYMLKKLKENDVTPVELDDVICDFAKQIL